ncbi:MAG: hypothetical protein IKF14_18340 [Atopobiaceae bacterium]|nr:hypothetical protein [Atopobiaceae bacterium]MBR3161049.1 hypothetical protein [Atopobiaceae bacterium]
MPSETPRQVVGKVLSEVGVPVTWDAWPTGKAPPLPWIAFSYMRGGEVYADNENYAELCKFKVGLYYKEYDPELETAFKSTLARLGTYRRYDDVYLSSEHCYLADYEIIYQPNREKGRP